MVRAGVLALVPAWGEQSFHVQYEVSCRFFTDTLYHTKGVRLVPSLLRVFCLFLSHEWVPILWNAFSIVFGDYHMVFPFWSANAVNYVGFRILNQPCIPGINHTLSWSIFIFMNGWIQRAKFLRRALASVFMRGTGQDFSSLVVYLSGFGIRVAVSS